MTQLSESKSLTNQTSSSRSSEPIWWALFSAGGVCFAVFIPSVVLFLALLLPLGIVELTYTQATTWLFSVWGLMFVGACIVLPAFHAAHRIRHGLHDLKIQQHTLVTFLCYGLAALLSVLVISVWVMGVF
jgi:fumarate reductase subunit D